METGGNRTVYRQTDGVWANACDGAAAPETLHATQQEAVAAARWFLTHHCGGRLTVKDAEGGVVSSEVVEFGGGSGSARDAERGEG